MNEIKLTINNETNIYKNETTGLELIDKFAIDNIICIKVNNKYKPLDYEIKEDSTIEFIDYLDVYGNRLYVNGLKFLFIIAVKEILGKNSDVEFCYSIDRGIYTRIKSKYIVNREVIDKIKSKIEELIKLNYSFEMVGVLKNDLSEYYIKTNQIEKSENLNLLIGEYANINKCGKYYGYFYGKLPIKTSYIKEFDITLLNNNTVILNFPVPRGGFGVPPYKHRPQIINVIDKYEKWLQELDCINVNKINNIISDGSIKQFVLMNELNQNKRLIEIANIIKENKNTKKLILIAGPSSSGKTTTSSKLSIYLKELGLNPHILSTDDYFVNREDTPLDENGEPDYESINTIDLKLFNSQLSSLLNGDKVSIPTFNFLTGKKEYKDKYLKLERDDILIIEGLHTLNEELTKTINRNKKLKIYLSPFTPLAIDTYNHISSSDLRLLRRILRDYRTRGYTVIDTLKNWQKVRKGEEVHVFPYQDEADLVFNTALIYEIGVLKVYVEPLLYAVKNTSMHYEESRRLLRFLNNFLPIASEYVPKDSILREFIGESCFY